MYTLMPYTDEYRSEWDDFARKHGTIFHSRLWMDVISEVFGYKCRSYMAVTEGRKSGNVTDEKKDGAWSGIKGETGADGVTDNEASTANNNIEGILPLLVGRNLYFQKVGVSLPCVNYLDICATKDAKKYLLGEIEYIRRNENLKHIELRLRHDDSDFFLYRKLPGNWRINCNNAVFFLPLEGGEEKILSLASSDSRNHTRKTWKNNWFRKSLDSSTAGKRLQRFYPIYQSTMKRLGSPALPQVLFERILQAFPENAWLLTVEDAVVGDVVGGMLLIGDKETLYYPWGASNNQRYVNNFMYMEAARLGIEKGYRYLDLGRSPIRSDAKGTYHFKKQFGATPIPLYYMRVGEDQGSRLFSEENGGGVMALGSELWKRTPDFITDPAGKLLVRKLYMTV